MQEPGLSKSWSALTTLVSVFVQIPLRDCKEIEFVEKENNPFNE